MYQEFFGLKEAPFSIAPNPHYLYMSKQHHEALAHLVYGVGRDGGFVLLTGEVGTGKTTICRCFLEQLPVDTDVAFILNPKLNAEQLLATICDELSISYFDDDVSIKDLVDNINHYLLKSHAQGRHTVLIIDEAQNLSPEVLEQLRLLTNLETHEKKLLQIVLLGQPELQDMFLRPDLRQLAQRVTARFHLKELRSTEIGPYVRHRLGVAGGRDIVNIFPDKTLKKLYSITSGVPRIINLVCDRAMLGAYAQNMRSVDVRTLELAAREILGASYSLALRTPKWFKMPLPSQSALLVVIAIMGVMLLWLASGVNVKVDIAPATATATAQNNDEKPASKVAAASGSGEIAGKIQRHDGTTDNAAQSGEVASDDATGDEVAGENKSGEDFIEAPSQPAVIQPTLASFLLDETAGNELDAYRELMGVWNVAPKATTPAQMCQQAKRNNLLCMTRSGSLGFIRHLGLPAVVTLYADNGKKAYALLRKLEGGQATLWIKNQELTIAETEFNQVWRGNFTMAWKVPDGFSSPLQPGSISPLTRWLREGFAVIDKQAPRQSGSSYDKQLEERVKAFQREMGEPDDGIVGEATLILLSRKLDSSLPLLTQGGEP